MIDLLTDYVGVEPWIGNYIILPILIILDAINTHNPKAFYTIESVKSASEYQVGETSPSRFTLFEKITSKRK